MELTTATDQHVLDHTEQVATGISWGDYLQLECQLHSSVNVTRAKSKSFLCLLYVGLIFPCVFF